MTKIASLLTLLVTVLVCSLPAVPALAQRDRVFVASYGNDSNPCTFGSPCKTFQQAINVVAQGGEVTAIDSAGFGPISISHAVTITSPNGVEAGVAGPASGNAAITIAAGTNDTIDLSGLTLDGDNVSLTTGIQFTTGGSLHVQNCVVRNFTFGINFEPTASSALSVSNTLLSDNLFGVQIAPSGSGAIIGILDHVEIGHGTNGLTVSSGSSTVNVAVTDSVVASNQDGIYVDAPNAVVTPMNIMMVRNSTIANNTSDGLIAVGAGSSIYVTRSTITGNDIGWATVNSGTVTSFGDNNIIGNLNGGNGAPPSIEYE